MHLVSMLLLGMCLFSIGATAQEKFAVGVELSRTWKMDSINWNLNNYGIGKSRYETKDFGSTPNQDFIKDLGKAQLLSIGTGASDNLVFSQPEHLKALEDFLARGGTVLYQYNSGIGSPALWKKQGLGAIPTLQDINESVRGEANATSKSELLSKPNDLRKFTGFFQYWGASCYPKWTDKQEILIHKVGDPNAGLLLLFENVLGKGRIIINRTGKLNMTPAQQSKQSKALSENIMRYVWGELKEGAETSLAAEPQKQAEAETAGARKGRASNLPVEGLNPLYLRGLEKTFWWNAGWSQRLPVIVREPMGLDRRSLVVTLEHKFQAKTDISSIRVVTSGGREIPSQARVVNVADNVLQISFADDFDANATNGYFIYSDSQTKPAPQYITDIAMRHADGIFTLSNSFTKAALRDSSPSVLSLQPQGNSTGNQFKSFKLVEDLGMGFQASRAKGFEAAMLEDGPIRKTVEYRIPGKEGAFIRYSMDVGSRLLCLESDGPISGSATWQPGKGVDDLREDSFCYPAKSGIRKIEFTVEDRDPSPELIPELAEGWYAFVDGATGQTVGELFDLGQAKKLNFSLYSARSANCTTLKGNKNAVTRRALVALPDNAGAAGLRQEYLKFKNPPQVALGVAQERAAVSETTAKPVWGKDFIAGCHVTPRDPFFQAWGGAYGRYFDILLPRMRERGFNLFNFWIGSSLGILVKGDELSDSLYAPLREKTAARGMLIATATPLVNPKAGGVSEKYAHLEPLRRMGGQDGLEPTKKLADELVPLILKGNKLDALALLDESTYKIKPGDKEAFRKLYNMDPVDVVDPRKLAEPAQHNTVIFQINAYTELLRTMAAAAKRTDPDVVRFDQVNPSSMNGLSKMHGGTHDWEIHGEFLDSISMDLYDKPTAAFKSFTKFMTAMFGNQKAVTLFIGCTTRPEHVYSSIAAPLMWGAGTFIYFTPRNTNVDNAWSEVGRSFSYFAMTGLGDWMAAARQNKRVALLRDREAMFDAIRKGRWGNGNLYDVAVAEMSQIKNLQSDIVMTRHFDAATAAKYPVLYVVSDPVLADAHVKTIEEYVKNGGHAVIECETIKSPAVQALTGVKSDGVAADAKTEVKGQFSFTGTTCAATAAGAEAVLMDDNGKPVIFERKLGKGTVSYIPAAISSRAAAQDDIRGFLRNLFDRLSGPQLISIDSENMEWIDSSLQEDGKGGYMFSAWNPGFEARHVTATWNGSSMPEILVDYALGLSQPFPGSFEFDLPGNQVKQFFLGAKGMMAIPEAKVVPEGSMPGYSSTPGSDIVDYQAPKPAAASAVGRPAKLPGNSYVGVFTPPAKSGGGGAEAILASLATRKGVKAESITDLDPGTLAYYDAVVIPNIGLYGNMKPGWEESVNNYVQAGGGALICHRSIGYKPCTRPPLPEIGRNLRDDSTMPIRDMEVVADHQVTSDLVIRQRYPEDYKNPAYDGQMDATALKVGDRCRVGFCDYVPIKPGEGTKTLVKGTDGNPAVVAGRLGKGKAVLAGMAIGQDEKGAERMAPDDEKILVNSIYWLVEKQQ